MRNAAEFNAFYAEPDPWHISRAKFRDKVLRRSVHKFVTGKSVLELGCGEGHLTQTIFDGAKTVTGIDLSDVAIERAKACAIPNARFENADFLEVSFKGYDVITAIECLYYLTPDDQETFFEKVACDHRGKPLILSGPIIGSNEYRKYFTDESLRKAFARHGLSVMETHNLNVYRRGAMANLAAGLVRLPLCSWLLDYLPRDLIYQRLYAVAQRVRSRFNAGMPELTLKTKWRLEFRAQAAELREATQGLLLVEEAIRRRLLGANP